MFSSTLGALLVDTALLGALIFFVARHNADRNLLNLILVAGGTTIGALVIDAAFTPVIGPFSLVVTALLCGILLIKVTETNPVQAAIIVGVFFAVKIGLRLALAYVFSDT